MFTRNGSDILTFRVYDGYGNCIDEFTGTMAEWQYHVADGLVDKAEPVFLHPSQLN
jgi:hypothetical protein